MGERLVFLMSIRSLKSTKLVGFEPSGLSCID
jgi:hypothetical protein